MMEIFFFQAECGDSARLRFIDDQNKPRNVFIDSGFERTFDHVLGDEISEIENNGEKINMWIISHIHDDHIGGTIKYVKNIIDGRNDDIVEEWLFNAPRDYNNIKKIKEEYSFAASIGQGDELYDYIRIKKPSNVKDITSSSNEIDLYGLKIKVLSPSLKKLKRLRNKYKLLDTSLEKIEDESISFPVSSKDYDYDKKLEDFKLDEWDEDTSIENGSSISFISEYFGKKILWLADSHPSDIEKSLKKMGYSSKNKFSCDWVKVSHHGSAKNSSNELYNLIECTNYLISVNGENRHYLPTKESLARIILNKNRDLTKKYYFHFTYDNSILRKIFQVDRSDIFTKWNFEVNFSSARSLKFDLSK